MTSLKLIASRIDQSWKQRNEESEQKSLTSQLQNKVQEQVANLNLKDKKRIESEYFGLGPLQQLIEDLSISEILISTNQIFYERNGSLEPSKDQFLSDNSQKRIMQLLFEESNLTIDSNSPFANGRWRDFRIHAVHPPISQAPLVSLRRIRNSTLSLEDWQFSSSELKNFLEKQVSERKSIVIFGSTGSGKTTLLSSLLARVHQNDRCLLIEDSDEILTPNPASVKLLTRKCPNQPNIDVDLNRLVFESLRMRPDRLILGEVRGAEAKDLLMALATGHRGGLCTLHADSAKQALIRLEMLIQLGAPQWSLQSIRRLIQLSIDIFVHVKKDRGIRLVQSVDRVCGLEEFGVLIESVYA